MKIRDDRVITLLRQSEALLDTIPNFTSELTVGSYLRRNAFPDLSFDALQANTARAKLLLRQIDALGEEPALASFDLLALDMLRYLLLANLYPQFSPTDEAFYDLDFDVLPYTFPLSFVWSDLSGYPFDTQENALKHAELVSDYPRFTAQFLEKLERQSDKGIYLYAAAIDSAIATLRAFAVPADQHPLSMRDREGAASEAQLRFEDDCFEQGRRNLLACAEYLARPEYRAKAPDSVGLYTYPGGEAYYRYLIRHHLNDDPSPEYVHELGKELLAEAIDRQAAIRRRAGMIGSHAEFVDSLRNDPRFFPPDGETALRILRSYADRFTASLPSLIDKKILTPCTVEMLPSSLESGMTFGHYSSPKKPGGKGIYYFNCADIREKCNLYGAALMAHELNPGHHLQLSAVFEDPDMEPLFKRSACTCYGEGWAEYAAALVGEQGLYSDEYDEYGRLEMEKFTCARLIADTGLNAFGWSLKKAAAFMTENSFVNHAQARSEVLRYATNIPAQCLPYRYGSLKLMNIRDRCRAALKDQFDLRRFNSAILGVGAVPMDALDRYLIREANATLSGLPSCLSSR